MLFFSSCGFLSLLWGLVAQDGTVLYGLLEVLSKQSLAVLGKVKPERNKIKKIANMNIVWK